MERGDINRVTKELEELLELPQDMEKLTGEAENTEETRGAEEIRGSEEIRGAGEIRGVGETRAAGETRAMRKPRGVRNPRAVGKTGGTGTAVHSGTFLNARDGLLAAFFVPVMIVLIIYIARGVFPFGDKTVLRMDMYHQYAPFLEEFQDRLKNGGSLAYSWNVGMGINFAALYSYYLASPFNWLLAVFPSGHVLEFLALSILLKTGLCGLAMAYYLQEHSGRRDFGTAFFGIFYALSGYMAAYNWNVMWLDCIWLFPLVVLGLERLVHDGRGKMYCVALGISILSNYYIAFMICIFLTLYFVALLIMEERMGIRRFFAACGRFAGYSLLAGGMAAVTLLPELSALGYTASVDATFPKKLNSYFSIFDMIARHIPNIESEVGLNHWPNIYCGVAVLMLFLLYLASREVKLREKAVYCGLLLVFFASFSVDMLNFMWHGFHYPNSLPCRQSFIYIFLMLVVCYRAYSSLPGLPKRYISAAFWGACVFVLLAEKLVDTEHFQFWMFYVAIIYLAMYAGIMFLYGKGRRYRTPALLLALTLVSVEAAVNTTVTSITTVNRDNYMKDDQDVKELVQSLQPNRTFYRVDKKNGLTKNDGAWEHFPSASLFSSMAHEELSDLLKKLGCEASTNAYSLRGSTPLVDSLLAVKYTLWSNEPQNSGLRNRLGARGETYLYENTYALPLGFEVPYDFEGSWRLDMGSPVEVQNDLAESLGASPVLVRQLEENTDGSSFTFTAEEAGEYYVHVTNKRIEKVNVSTYEGVKSFDNVDRGYLLELGYCKAGEQVTLMAEETSEPLYAEAYRFSEKGLASVYDKLGMTPWRLTSWTDTFLSGTVDSRNGGILFTSVPYDDGWTIMVDGIKCAPRKMLDAFIGVEITGGSHEITMSYEPEGLRRGALIGAGSLALLILLAAYAFMRKKPLYMTEDTMDRTEEKEEEMDL